MYEIDSGIEAGRLPVSIDLIFVNINSSGTINMHQVLGHILQKLSRVCSDFDNIATSQRFPNDLKRPEILLLFIEEQVLKSVVTVVGKLGSLIARPKALMISFQESSSVFIDRNLPQVKHNRFVGKRRWIAHGSSIKLLCPIGQNRCHHPANPALDLVALRKLICLRDRKAMAAHVGFFVAGRQRNETECRHDDAKKHQPKGIAGQ